MMVWERLCALAIVLSKWAMRGYVCMKKTELMSNNPTSSVNEMHRQQQEYQRKIKMRDEGKAYSRTPHLDAMYRFAARCLAPVARLYAALYDLISWLVADVIMHLRGKAYKPSSPETTSTMLDMMRPVIERFGDPDQPPPFVDLGCGRGTQLPAVRRACCTGGRPLFGSVVGVELDEDTYKEAVKTVGADGIDLVCSCLFKFVDVATRAPPFALKAKWRERRWPEVLTPAGVVFYMYEPLWAAGMPLNEVHAKYELMLSTLVSRYSSGGRKQRERVFLIYMTGISDRHIPKEMLDRNDFMLYSVKSVTNSGVINKLSGTTNTLEVWQLSYTTSAPQR